MKQVVVLLCAIFVLFLSGAGHVDAHKFHASLTQIDYNDESGKAEISVRLFVDDLEAALSRRADVEVRIDGSPEIDRSILAYLDETLLIQTTSGSDPVSFEWVGKEINVDVVWVFVQADLRNGLDGVHLINKVFFELFVDQVNIVNLREGDRRVSYSFKPGTSMVPIDLSRRDG